MEKLTFMQNPTKFDTKNIANILVSNGWGSEYKDISIKETFSSSSYYEIAKIDNKEIGYIRAFSDNTSVSFICELIVHCDYQKQGIGSKLLEQFCDEFKHTAIYTVGNKNKSKFLQKFGIKEIDNFLAYSKPSL